ncbi:MAG: hypothetical protein ABSF10_08495 [Verrucomicrobiota bacterium]|jgi:hypothetical protein
MNALLCIGCNAYDHLRVLEGAEKDAKEVFDLLSNQNGFYDQEVSCVLLSPATNTIIDALNKVFPAGKEIDVFTFFFAGHAGVKASSFYLCARESESERLSTTAFPITSLFSIINEFRPGQVNIVVDACEAGGSSFDLAQLLKPEVIGHSDASSITFLGACSSDQFASETPDGGILTRQLIKCMTGEREIQTKSPFLDLIEMGAAVCQDVLANHPKQKPISWGLSLFGNGRFAQNPHFDSGAAERIFPTGSILPQSEMGKRIRLNSAALWNEYRTIKEDPNPRRLLDLLDSVFRGANGDVQAIIASVQGLARTLSARARESSELLAPSQCLATCAVSLLPNIESEIVRSYTLAALREIMVLDMEVWSELLASVKSENHTLLNNIGVMADLYYLPMRITRILGWIGLSIVAESLFPELDDGNDSLRFSLASALVNRYGDSLVAVSDEQASSLYVFLKACLFKNQTELAEHVIIRYFASFADKKGNVNRAGTDGVQAYRYILSLGPEQFRPQDWRPANPSHLLPVLLLFGQKLGLGAVWDLRAIDRVFGAFFIPANYRDFGRKVIDRGINYTQQIGFGVWSLSDFNKEFERAIKESFTSDTLGFSKEGATLCTIASLLFPDRLPLLLERTLAGC